MLSLITGFFGFLNPTKILIMLGMSAAIFAGGFYTAWHYKGLEEQAALVSATQKVVETEQKQDTVTEHVAQEEAQKQVEMQARTVVQIKQVVKYVPVKADNRCVINTGFVQLHNAAASGQDPVSTASGKPDGATSGSGADKSTDSGVKLSEVASTVIQNYGTYQQVAEQLRELQAWVKDQQAASQSP